MTHLELFYTVFIFSAGFAVLAAVYNSFSLKEKECMNVKYNLVEERKQAKKDWHKWQYACRAFVIISFIGVISIDWLNGLLLLIVAIPVSWIFFDQPLNLFRGLKFLHKGTEGVDMLFKSELLFFVFKCVCLVGAVALYFAIYF